MAGGTLPGVETARRRRFHHSASENAASWIRMSSSSSMRTACYIHEHHKEDEKLVGLAKEAKKRLDEKLKNQRAKSFGHPPRAAANHHNVKVLKRIESKRQGWKMKLVWNWKTSEQDECCICLERFKLCESLVHLRCAHKFHTKCLSSWIDCNAQCPCCRMSLS